MQRITPGHRIAWEIYEGIPCFSNDLVWFIHSFLPPLEPLGKTTKQILPVTTSHIKQHLETRDSRRDAKIWYSKETSMWRCDWYYSSPPKPELKPPMDLWRAVQLERLQQKGEAARKRIEQYRSHHTDPLPVPDAMKWSLMKPLTVVLLIKTDID